MIVTTTTTTLFILIQLEIKWSVTGYGKNSGGVFSSAWHGAN